MLVKKIASEERSISKQSSSHGFFTLSGSRVPSFKLCSLASFLGFVLTFDCYHFLG